jgi:hypothetical protein
VLHVLAVEPFRQVRRDVAGAVVGEKPWPINKAITTAKIGRLMNKAAMNRLSLDFL